MLKELRKDLRKYASKKQAKILQWFFKTAPGEYAEGDIFIGVKVPQIRAVVKKYKDLGLKETIQLLKSKIHEERLAALLILVSKFHDGDNAFREKIYSLYLKHADYINNWDLVDLSAHHIAGSFLIKTNKGVLYLLAKSRNMWKRRISIVSTFHFIKNNKFDDTLKIAKLLINDKEDLIHKATGWMLREVGKRDITIEEKFLKKYYRKMPRTMLRYAIERFPEPKRLAYLNGRV